MMKKILAEIFQVQTINKVVQIRQRVNEKCIIFFIVDFVISCFELAIFYGFNNANK